MANKILKDLAIGGITFDAPQGTTYTAGENINITNKKISLITSPALKGTPTAPTNGTASTNNTQVATTAFVQSAIANRLGTTSQDTVTDSLAVKCAANTWKDGASVTVTQKGLYLVNATATFVAGSSTGNTGQGLRIYVGSTNIAGTIIPCEFSKETQLVVTTWIYITANTVVKMQKVCGLAESTAGNTSISAKLVYKPRT